MLCFRKFPVVKKLMDERVGGISRFSVEKYLSDSAENFRGWGEFFRVSFISGIDKNWIRGGGRQCQDFPAKIFCLTVLKNLVRKHLVFH